MKNNPTPKKNVSNSATKPLYHDRPVFIPEVKEITIDSASLVFAFHNSKMLLMQNSVPSFEQLKQLNPETGYIKYIGTINKKRCFAVELIKRGSTINKNLVPLRKLYNILLEHFVQAAVYAHQLLRWISINKYCGKCGTETVEKLPSVLVKACPECGVEYFPKISPSIIVAVTKKNKLLLALHKRVTNGMYTVLAGFVNPGETLEECVQREVLEEAGIEVDNIRYFGSQPWPFPDSLMIAFTAEYVHGELKADEEEITDLKWFLPEEIPEWPDKVSIARTLIDDFIGVNCGNR